MKESAELCRDGSELSKVVRTKHNWKCYLWTPAWLETRGCSCWWVADVWGLPYCFNFLSKVKSQVISLVMLGEPQRHHEFRSSALHKSKPSCSQQDCLRVKGITEDHLEINGTSFVFIFEQGTNYHLIRCANNWEKYSEYVIKRHDLGATEPIVKKRLHLRKACDIGQINVTFVLHSKNSEVLTSLVVFIYIISGNKMPGIRWY